MKTAAYSMCVSLVCDLLTGIWSRHLGLQLLDLFNQQRDVLQQVFVLQQQLVDSSLGLQPRRGLRTQLVLQQVDLHRRRYRWTDRGGESREGEEQKLSAVYSNFFPRSPLIRSALLPLESELYPNTQTHHHSTSRAGLNSAGPSNRMCLSGKSEVSAICFKCLSKDNTQTQKNRLAFIELMFLLHGHNLKGALH